MGIPGKCSGSSNSWRYAGLQKEPSKYKYIQLCFQMYMYSLYSPCMLLENSLLFTAPPGIMHMLL